MSALEALQNEDFLLNASMVSTVEALRLFLANRQEVVDLRKAINSGEIAQLDIEQFVYKILKSFQQGKKFSNEICLAAIAVALESYPAAFAKDYLDELSRLRIMEIPFAARIARLSLLRRSETMIDTTHRLRAIPAKDLPSLSSESFHVDAYLTDKRFDLAKAS